MKIRNNGFFYAIAQGMLFGLVHVVIQSAVRTGDVSRNMGLFFRFFIGGLILLPIALRRLKYAPLPKGMLWKVFLAALGMLVTTLLLYASYTHISTGMGVTLHYTYPIVTLLISILFFRTRLNWKMLLSIGLSFLGIVLLCDVGSMGASALTGIVLALASAVTFSCYLLWIDHQKLNAVDPIILTKLINMFNSVGLFIYNAVHSDITFTLSPKAGILLLVSGVVGVLAILTINLAIQHAGAVYTSILGTLEPITSTVGGALILHEPITGAMVMGSTLVIAAVVFATLSSKKKTETLPPCACPENQS